MVATDIPSAIIKLLQQYNDIFPYELPLNLPSMQYIQNAIDWISRGPLPNKVAYRMAPKEKEDLQKQVQELLDRCGRNAFFLEGSTPRLSGSGWRKDVGVTT